VLGASVASVGWASDLPGASTTAEILGWIDEKLSRKTPEDRAVARRLDADGDRAYKKKNYREAHTMYYNSFPNYPNAYAYIMSGDSHWREVVRYHEGEAAKQAPDRPACSLDNKYFPRDLALDLARYYEVGIALAERENNQRFIRSTFYRRARESATCLRAVAQHYDSEPPTSCIDIAQLRNCLGPPLIK
jgi:hypothetical protein